MKLLKIKHLAFALALLSVVASGCKKFLAEQSQSLQYANNSVKLQEVLNGTGYMPHYLPPIPTTSFKNQSAPVYFGWLNAMDDDITEAVISPYYTDQRADVFGFYTWQSNPFVSPTYVVSNDDTWAKVYVNINACNIIAYQATTLNDNPAELNRIRGEALFLRANYYFYMVNTYAKAYNPVTAKTDLGVPLKTAEFVQDNLFTRSTVDSVYQQMITDLKNAETLLAGVTQSSIYHVDVNAVNILQSRIYLYMQDWANAAVAADKVIARKPMLYNLAGYQAHTSFFSASSPETVFTQGGNAMCFLMSENFPKTFQPSPDLMSLYQPTDLRRLAFFERDNLGKYRYTKMYISSTYNVQPVEVFADNFFMRNAEAYLNKAEAAAMAGNTADANTAINTLRQSRFLPADYTPINLADVSLINFIRDERRRELCFEGHRWFDLKRYAINPKYPFTKTIVHTYSDVVYGSAPFLKASLVLQPGDPDYLIPIPAEAIVFNQGVLIQNPTRQDRTF
ncbi:RagB/SusD family nutrient uptake outer membrane protein [Mucilaginibacter paludis]|uniref:RagB/SusD domain-containing protein n=1 Tax=Mucilaginibacter paludis DSM 18603 TaxID=714943 RepID=H1YFY9_9SPHI|nr:RagB/SusD family nutrient uptake outer membrane protein [Mucilaginibacter paludis]EHQ26277.1 RagB/SusD domain-containing protein [Mucilaginibacter paludis DSM 18603]